jgi:hypothetical protein
MTIHQTNHNQLEPVKVEVLDHAKRLRPLSLHNPWDYMRLLIWVLFQPQYIKAYRIRCDIPHRQMLKKQALILSMFFIWLPFIPLLIVPRILDNLPLNFLVITVMLLLVVGALVTSVQFGLATKRGTINGLTAGMIVVPFAITAVLAYTLQETGVSSIWLVGLTSFTMTNSMLGMGFASIFKLKTAEKIAVAVTIILGGGLATIIFTLQEAAWLPISAIIIMAFIVGVIEERYEMKMNLHR